MPLNDKEWGEFLFKDIFEIKKGFYNKKPGETEDGNIPFLGATDSNNGVTRFLSLEMIKNSTKTGSLPNSSINKKLFDGHAIAVTNNGSVGHAYYQTTPFTCSHDVNPLYLKDHKMCREEAMFLIETIQKQGKLFQYARKWRPKRMVKSKAMLPINDKGDPDYAYMSEYVQEQKEAMLAKYRDYANERVAELGDYVDIPALDDKDWKEFKFDCLFDLLSVQQKLSGSDLDLNATTPVYTSQTTNNGISGFTHKDANFEARPNKEMLVFGDHTRAMNIAQYPFAVADNVKVLKPKDVSFYSLQFVATVWQKRIPDIGYARHWRKAKAVGLSLPINNKGEPDFEYMEQYAKNIMVKKYKQYLAFAENQDGDELSGKK